MTLRLFHLADVHFGAKLRAPKMPEHVARTVEARRRERFGDLMQRAHDEKIDAVLIAGDLFDRPRILTPHYNHILDACDAAAPAEVVIIPGNHDYWTDAGVWTHAFWPGNVTILHGADVQVHKLSSDKATIYAHGWNRSDVAVSPFHAWPGPPRPSRETRIIMAHGSELNTQPSDWKRYAAFYAKHFAQFDPSYVALGHLHWFSSRTVSPGVEACYPGSFASTGFDDTGKKGYLNVEITPAGTTISHQSSGAIEFEQTTIRGTELDSPQELTDIIMAYEPSRRARTALWVNVVGVLRQEVARSIAAVHALCRNEFAHLTIHERATLATNETDERAQKSPLDDFVSEIDQLIHSEVDRNRKRILERVREHGLTAAYERRNPRMGSLYQ